MVTAVMAALAMPLGPLLRSHAAAARLRHDIVGSMVGIVAFSLMSGLGTTRWSGSRSWRCSSSCWCWAPASGVIRGRWSMTSLVAILGAWSSRWAPSPTKATRGRPTTASPPTTTATARRRSTSTASPTRRSTRHVRPRRSSTTRSTTGSRAGPTTTCWSWAPGSGSDVALALAARRQARGRRGDRPRHPAHRHRAPPGPALRRPARHAHINDGRAFLRGTDKQVRPDRVRAARLADAGQQRRERAPGVASCSRSRHSGRSATTSPTTACSCSTTTTATSGWWPSSRACSRTRSEHAPLLRTYDHVKATLAAGPAVAALDGGSAPGRHGRPDPVGDGRRAHARHGRLAVPVPAQPVRGRLLPGGAGGHPAGRPGRGRGRGARDRHHRCVASAPTSSCWAPRSCCSRRAAW